MPPNIPDLYTRWPDLPWQYSASRQCYFVYLSQSDELLFNDGSRVARPEQLSASQLASAAVSQEMLKASAAQSEAGRSSTVPRTNPPARYPATSAPQAGSSSYATSSLPDMYTTSSYPTVGSSSRSVGSAMRDIAGSDDDPLTDRMGSMSLNAAPTGQPILSRDKDGKGYIAKVNVQRGRSLALDPPLQGLDAATISGADVVGAGQTEALFPGYKVRPASFFFPGKVLILLWSETAGSTINGPGADTTVTEKEQAVIRGPHGELIYSKVRRFVVIRHAKGYCNALPILTYGRRGVGKPGVTKSEHAIIYTNPMPKPLSSERARPGEEPMQPTTIRVDPDTKAEKLDELSRLNFGHLVTIQYNVKVKSCGKVAKESMKPLMAIFSNVFDLGQSLAPPPEPQQASGSGTADDKVSKALTALIDRGITPQDAVKQVLDALIAKGLDREDAVDLIRKAYK